MIEVNNLTTNQIDREFFKKVARIVLMGENKEKLELSIVLVGQARIRKLNKKYRQNYRSTDVLSFIYRASEESEGKEEDEVLFAHDDSGEIVICLQEVKKNAKKFHLSSRREDKRRKTFLRPSLKKELAKVLIHGILHLLGYDHEKSEKAAEQMEEKQEHYLRKIYG